MDQVSVLKHADMAAPQSTKSQATMQGLIRVSPLLLGVFPFALIAGTTAISKGLNLPEAFGFSWIIFAGAAQLAALELIGQQAPLFVVLMTAWIINIRMIIYSAAIAPHFRDESIKWRALLAYLLTDQAFVLSADEFEKFPERNHKSFFYLGAGMGLFTTWQIGSAIGILVGGQLPPALSLDFAIPLTFIALLVPALKNKATLIAALSAGIAVVVLASVPLNLGFVAAIVIGIVSAWTWERSQS